MYSMMCGGTQAPEKSTVMNYRGLNVDDHIMMMYSVRIGWDAYTSIELSYKSMGVLIRSWLFYIQHLLCLGSFWCMCGGLNVLY